MPLFDAPVARRRRTSTSRAASAGPSRGCGRTSRWPAATRTHLGGGRVQFAGVGPGPEPTLGVTGRHRRAGGRGLSAGGTRRRRDTVRQPERRPGRSARVTGAVDTLMVIPGQRRDLSQTADLAEDPDGQVRVGAQRTRSGSPASAPTPGPHLVRDADPAQVVDMARTADHPGPSARQPGDRCRARRQFATARECPSVKGHFRSTRSPSASSSASSASSSRPWNLRSGALHARRSECRPPRVSRDPFGVVDGHPRCAGRTVPPRHGSHRDRPAPPARGDTRPCRPAGRCGPRPIAFAAAPGGVSPPSYRSKVNPRRAERRRPGPSVRRAGTPVQCRMDQPGQLTAGVDEQCSHHRTRRREVILRVRHWTTGISDTAPRTSPPDTSHCRTAISSPNQRLRTHANRRNLDPHDQ